MRSKKKKPDPSPPPVSPGWIYKTSPKGNQYRVCTIPLDLLPSLLEAEKLEPRIPEELEGVVSSAFFYFPAEKEFVLGVGRIPEKKESDIVEVLVSLGGVKIE